MAVGLISVSTDIGWRITVAWLAGNVLCKIIRFLQTVVTFSSTYVLVALSIDRYDAITHPMNFSGSCKYCTNNNTSRNYSITRGNDSVNLILFFLLLIAKIFRISAFCNKNINMRTKLIPFACI